MPQLDQLFLFAAEDWWKIVGFLFLMAFYGLQHILSSRQEEKQARKKKARPPRKPPERAAGQAAQPANQADPLRAEVEAFLRETEGKKQGRPEGRGQRPPGRGRQPRPEPPRRPVPTARPVATPRRPIEAEVIPIEVIDPREEDVAQHVTRHLSRKRVTEGAEHLGEQVALADDRLETRLEEKFEHQIGRLDHTEGQGTPQESAQSPSVAEELRQLLSQPQGMRQLIVANEILRRPEERW